MTEDEKLIPGLSDWRQSNGDPISITDWTAYEGSMSLAIAYSFLFWPEFIEHDGCVILKNRFDTNNFEDWKKTVYVKTYGQIESVLNHIHILDLFGTDEKRNEIGYEQIRFLGNRICAFYAAKLNIEFPGREFVFSFNGDEVLEAFDEYELTFYQKANLQRPIK